MVRRIDMESHRLDQQLEDVEHLVEHGETYEAACARVGLIPDSVARRETRARERGAA